MTPLFEWNPDHSHHPADGPGTPGPSRTDRRIALAALALLVTLLTACVCMLVIAGIR